jgi:carboxyl-terminal processing protease
VPPDAKDDKALKMADDLLHGIKSSSSANPAATDDKSTGDKASVDKPAASDKPKPN